MSGTSLDGLDLVLVTFDTKDPSRFKIIKSQTIVYSQEWKSALSNAIYLDANSLEKLDNDYGFFLGEACNTFIKSHDLHVDLIASHGHTVFHQPHLGLTRQIGSGSILRSVTGIPLVNNFRAQDVKLGGQGAPLVPFGDELLFGNYFACLNLGGFANVSWNSGGLRYACDIGPCNILFNTLAQKLNKDYDPSGTIARTGKIIPELLAHWNALDFYTMDHPKSLGREWFEEHFLSYLENNDHTIEDQMCTSVEHLAIQTNNLIIRQLKHQHSNTNTKVLCTGGGVYNDYLMDRLQANANDRLHYIKAEPDLIDTKEALIFALLGMMKWLGKVNILASVTGAKYDHSSGDIYP